jgi:cyanate permease
MSIVHGFSNWLPKLLETRGMTPAMAGYAAAVPVLAGLPGIIFIPKIVPVHLRGRIVALLGLFTAAGIMLVATTIFPLLIGLLLYGIAISVMQPMFMLILMDLPEVGHKYMGSAGGIYFTVGEIGGFLGPFILGALVDLTGTFLSGASFIAFLGIMIVLLILMLRTSDDPKRV